MADERTIERTLRIEAAPEVVFRHLIDAELIPLWMGIGAEVEPRPGGIFRCAIGRWNVSICGRFIEVEEPHRVVFTWGWEGTDRLLPPGSSRVEFTLRADGDATLLTLRHSGLPEGQEEFHAFGWAHYLGRMADRASGRNPGPDRVNEDSRLRKILAELPAPIRN